MLRERVGWQGEKEREKERVREIRREETGQGEGEPEAAEVDGASWNHDSSLYLRVGGSR